MLTVKEKGIMFYIIKHCYRIEDKIKDVSFEKFVSDEDIKEIISFNVLQIGELAKNLSSDFLKQYPNMPWKDIKGMRDWVAHGYGTIDLEEVWNTATNDIKPLREYCEEIIGENS
ncbi:MAG: DUF86 domain-containing protein [Bacilli bacterium]|nr:DUF86 domain-containing protein [Bacilli bacterium]